MDENIRVSVRHDSWRLLTPLRGLVFAVCLPMAYAMGYHLAPLRG
jgi:hypothetical protein